MCTVSDHIRRGLQLFAPVLALMVVYLINKSTDLVILHQRNPTTDDGVGNSP